MVMLRHAIKIAAPLEATFRAVTEPEGMQPWHLGTVDGKFAIGEVIRLTPRPGMTFAWRTDEIDPGHAVLQTCVEGAGSATGKTLRIEVASLPDGRTLVSLADGEWDASDPHLPFCNTCWGEALARLRDHLEQTV